MWSTDSDRNKDSESTSTLQDIGAVLRQARESHGMTCEQLAGALNMGTEQLAALESGDLDRLPEPVFITAMTRRVASKLHVDSDSLIQRLQTALPNPSSRNTSEPGPSAKAQTTTQMMTVSPQHSWGRWITAAISVAAVAGGAMVLSSQQRSLQTTAIPTAPQAMPSEVVSNDDNDESDDSVVELETSTPPAVITITSSEPSWLSIRNSDGSELFEGTLADSKTLPADADVEIYAGRPDLVLISRGEETPKALGTIEEVRWYKLNP